MLKHIMLASSMIVALPVAAQAGGNIRPADAGQAQTAAQSRTTDTAVSSDMSAPAGQTQAAAPQQTAPATTTQPATAQAVPQATPQQPADATAAASGQPATQTATGDQVAQVVDQQFPTYDKDGNGQLSQSEFASWMVALKSQTDPTAKAESADTKAWVKGAFAQADKDKSRAISKPELLGFLSQGKS